MFGIKVLVTIAAFCTTLCAMMFVINDVTIKMNIGEFLYKTYTIVFILASIMLTKEAVSISTEKDYE